MKILAKVNFSFANLERAMPQIISKIVDGTVRSSAEMSREAILKGVGKGLEESTKEVRKLRGVEGTTPLLASKELFNSIQATQGGLQFKKYGQYHRDGFTPKYIPAINKKTDKPFRSKKTGRVAMTLNKKNINVEPRDFLRVGKVNTDNLQIKIRKALSK